MFRRLINAFRSQDKSGTREVTTVAHLRVGDLMTLKSRLSLPEELQGATFEVSQVGTYQFDDGIYMQLMLTAADRSEVHLGFSPKNSQGELCFSKTIGHGLVSSLFDEDQFSDVFEEGFSTLSVNSNTEGCTGWVATEYSQSKHMAEGYYFSRDMRGVEVSGYQDDSSEEFRYHELRGNEDQYEISIEIWGDGETDISLGVYCPAYVIDSLWPAESPE